VDLAYRALERALDHSASPLRQFALLTDFLSAVAELPPAWLASYAPMLLPRCMTVVGHAYVSGGDPARWLQLLAFLDLVHENRWSQHTEALATSINTVLEKLIYARACVGEYRNLHALLLQRGYALREISEQGWSGILTSETMGIDPLEAYCDAAIPGGQALPAILSAALAAWRHARRGGEIGVVLLDGGSEDDGETGTVLRLSLRSRRASHAHVHFAAELAPDNTETVRQLERCAKLAQAVVHNAYSLSPPDREYSFSFHGHAAEFRGASMGLAAALQLAVEMQKDFNRDVRWHLQPRMACIGGLRADGTVQESMPGILRRKIEVAFFSPVAVLVIAASQSEDALRIIRRLQMRYPFRQLPVHGVRTLEDCAHAEHILQRERRALSDRVSEFTVRHGLALLLAGFLLAAGIAGFFLWKYYYDYPDLELANGVVVTTGSIVYNPRADRPWSFRDGREFKEAVVPCGDLEVGDGYFRNFYIWNFSRFPLDLDITIEGPDADQWYCNWNGGRQAVSSLDTLRMMVMYAPTRPGDRNRARLVLRDPESQEELYAVALTGSAGAPLDGGYALHLDGKDDMLLFGKRSYTFGIEAATIEMWLKPDELDGCFFSNTRNMPDEQAIENMSLALHGNTLNLHVGSFRARILDTHAWGVRQNTWVHVALAYQLPDGIRPGRITLTLNGIVVRDVQEEFVFGDISQSYVTIGAYNDGTQAGGHFHGKVDELRLWYGHRSAEEIRSTMRRRVPGDTVGLRGYWNFDHLGEESAFVAYKRAQEGTPVGRPERVRSDAPVATSSREDLRLVDGPRKTRATELQPFRYLQCSRQLLRSDSARSYAIWFRNDGDGKRLFLTVQNQDAQLSIYRSGFLISGAGPIATEPRPGWNLAVVRVDRKQKAEFFLNGAYVGSKRTLQFGFGPFHRYVGMQVGATQDGYNHLTTSYYDAMHALFDTRRAVADLCVWDRRLGDEEIRDLQGGSVPVRGLLARWPLGHLPDHMGNYTDVTRGHLLHVLRISGWE
jgi:hypothetical protein